MIMYNYIGAFSGHTYISHLNWLFEILYQLSFQLQNSSNKLKHISKAAIVHINPLWSSGLEIELSPQRPQLDSLHFFTLLFKNC